MNQLQEAALLAAFRAMHLEDKEIFLDYAQTRAAKAATERRNALHLIVNTPGKQ